MLAASSIRLHDDIRVPKWASQISVSTRWAGLVSGLRAAANGETMARGVRVACEVEGRMKLQDGSGGGVPEARCTRLWHASGSTVWHFKLPANMTP